MNNQLDKLLMDLLDGLGAAFRKKILQRIWHIVIIDVHGAIEIVFHLTKVDGVFVVDVFQNVYFFV